MTPRHRNHLVRLGLAALVLALLAPGAPAKPDTQDREQIPDEYKWRLSDIYPSWEAWEKDVAKLSRLMEEFPKLQGTLEKGPKQVLKAYRMSDELGMLVDKIYAYAGLGSVVDTRDNELAAKVQEVRILLSEFGTTVAWFDPELLAIPWETMEKWLDKHSDLGPYRFSIENLYRQQEHVLDEEKEQLLSYFQPLRGNAPAAYNELSTSDIQFEEVVLSSGDTVTVSPGRYYNILQTNRSQQDRAAAFESFYGVFNADLNTYAALYNGVLQRDWAMARARDYDSCLESALDDDNIPVSVYENLIEQVRAGTEPVHRYNALRKKVLGLESYHGYDGSIPLVEFDRSYDYKEIQGWIIESVKPLGKEYQAMMKEAFGGGWLDVYENEGKRSGAFSAGVYGVHPFMLLNYNDTLGDFFTVAHELGHTLHTMLAQKNQPYATSDYTIFVAEVASTLNEALLLDYMLKKSEDPLERVALLMRAIEDLLGTFYTQVMFADFELQAHKLVEEGRPITADVLKEIYTTLFTDQAGPAVTFDEFYGGTWSRISHFYDVPFYVFQYATCYASSAQLVKGITSGDERDRKRAVENYLDLLKSGGDDHPMEQLDKAGVDLTKQETFQAVIEHMDDLVTLLEKEMEKL